MQTGRIIQGIMESSCNKSKNQLKKELKNPEKLKKFLKKQEARISPDEINIKNLKIKEDKETSEENQSKTTSGYDHKDIESKWYEYWLKNKFFKPESYQDAKENFVLVVPPPNVTASLHIGHALTVSIEDALCRWHRMNGKKVLYIPGCDHAGISTQAIVEKRLFKEKNLTRHQIGREGLVSEIWKWKNKYGDRIYDQFKRLGGSMDWDRACFTMDPKATNAVNEAFIKLYKDGLIFRANRLVNWSGKLQTAVSDLEVDSKEIEPFTQLKVYGYDKPVTFGVLVAIAYKLESSSSNEEIIIETTRPETVFADTAIAVHPNDDRYKQFIGRFVIHPVTEERLPIIADEIAKPDFGTGALKISPAHDFNDFSVAGRHNLKVKMIFDEHNILNENCGKFKGQSRFEARENVINFLKDNGCFRDLKGHQMTLPICNRSGDIIEPRLIPQWWLDCKKMAERSINAVRNQELQLLPKSQEKVWYQWLENIQDWCLSRQLYWGHHVPAYKVLINECNHSMENVWVVGRDMNEALQEAIRLFPNVSPQDLILEQDQDVLDTWFSSALWPLTTLGWPEKTKDFEDYFPQSLLETGLDILFFWVARMVMLSLYLCDKLPFKQVFLHSLVRDAYGRKMSKSLGNVIDPYDVIDGISLDSLIQTLKSGNLDSNETEKAIQNLRKEYPNGIKASGTDALRIALCSYVSEGKNINLNVGLIDFYRRFCNKIWNACKFAKIHCNMDDLNLISLQSHIEVDCNSWILSRLNNTIKLANDFMSNYDLGKAVEIIVDFWLSDFCDFYIECAKALLKSEPSDSDIRLSIANTLKYCVIDGLKLLHPFMPFITEHLYQDFRHNKASNESIMMTKFPTYNALIENKKIENDFDIVLKINKTIRSSGNQSSKFALKLKSSSLEEFLKKNKFCIDSLIKPRKLDIIDDIDDIDDSLHEPLDKSDDSYELFLLK